MSNRSGLSFKDLIIRVSEAAGVQRAPTAAGETAGTPTSTHHLDKVKRAINDGINVLLRDYPKWHGLRETYSISIDPANPGADAVGGDIAVQRLGPAISLAPNGKWTASSTSGYRVKLQTVALVELLSQSPLTAFPAMVAFEPLRRESQNDAPVWAVRIWPTPAEAITLTGLANLKPARMVDDDERHPLGAEHDMTVVHAALVEMYRGHTDRAVIEAAKQDYQMALASSRALEEQREPACLGQAVVGNSQALRGPRWGGVTDLSALTV